VVVVVAAVAAVEVVGVEVVAVEVAGVVAVADAITEIDRTKLIYRIVAPV
jgi:hypothetical protein